MSVPKRLLLKVNTASAMLLQLVTMLSGIILPRLILQAFGSEVNGLVSSISQFLSYITLMEAGTGSVMKAAMFKPLVDGDNQKLSGVVNESQRFFRGIAYVFLVYMLLMSVTYPFLSKNETFSYDYIFWMVLILGINSFAQYYFGLTYQLLLQADQKIYFVNILQIVTLVANVVLCALLINVGVSIHAVKLTTVIVFLLRPLVVNLYVRKHYALDPQVPPDKKLVRERWDGLAHHIAYFVHRNTDIAILTFFTTFSEISVYSVYNMVVTAVQGLISPFSGSVTSKFGELFAKGDKKKLEEVFAQYETFSFAFATVIYTVASIMIIPFVQVYTSGIDDVNYSRYVFAGFIVFAEFMYAIRGPYSNLIFAVGEFRGTKLGAFIESGLNVVISLALVHWLGLTGVAIGTMVAMAFRTVDYAVYLSKHVLNRAIKHFLKNLALSLVTYVLGYVLCRCLILPFFVFEHFGWWVVCAIITTTICTLLLCGMQLICNKKCFFASFKFFSN